MEQEGGNIWEETVRRRGNIGLHLILGDSLGWMKDSEMSISFCLGSGDGKERERGDSNRINGIDGLGSNTKLKVRYHVVVSNRITIPIFIET